MDEGQLNGDSQVLRRIRRYANEVVKGDEWPLEEVNLSKVTFEIRTRAKRRHGVAEYYEDGQTTIGISQHTLDNATEENVRETIRHELVHVWQHQHRGETVRLPNGELVENVTRGHTGSWYEWEPLMDVSRTNRHYETPPEEYKYLLACPDCGNWWGRYRLCKRVRQAVRGELSCPCGSDIFLYDPNSGLRMAHEDVPDHVIKTFIESD